MARGGTLIFSHIRRPGLFLGFKILISIFLGVLRKVYIFFWGGGGYEDFVDIFGVITKLASLRVISMHFGVFF